MKDDYTTNPHYLTYTFSLYKVGRMYFVSSGVKGLTQVSVYTMHKIYIALHKIMEAMRMAYAEKWDSVSTHSSILKGKRTSFVKNI